MSVDPHLSATKLCRWPDSAQHCTAVSWLLLVGGSTSSITELLWVVAVPDVGVMITAGGGASGGGASGVAGGGARVAWN